MVAGKARMRFTIVPPTQFHPHSGFCCFLFLCKVTGWAWVTTNGYTALSAFNPRVTPCASSDRMAIPSGMLQASTAALESWEISMRACERNAKYADTETDVDGKVRMPKWRMQNASHCSSLPCFITGFKGSSLSNWLTIFHKPLPHRRWAIGFGF